MKNFLNLRLPHFLMGMICCFCLSSYGQAGYWQQRVEYKMDIDFDVTTHQFTGDQSLTYYNNSPDTLHRVFYHLYFNAFQPGSMMDMKSLNISDPDPRVMDRISKLEEDGYGYHKIVSLKQDGKDVDYAVIGTILEVELSKPILPGAKSKFDMKFNSQVPEQIRRSGRNSRDGIQYTMTQWYPKMAEYDVEGWHANPYVGREFHGVWGDFDVKITIDSSYTIGGTGILQNKDRIGHGYGKNPKAGTKASLTWNFKAQNVHDFAWAADQGYIHDIIQVPDGPEVHFFYKPANEKVAQNWKELQGYTIRLFQIMNNTFGRYPWSKYSVIHGGDGGMEYPMCTMITGNRGNIRSLVGVTVHEVIHSWYQGALGNNESLYPWMDEGFTSFASAYVSSKLYDSERKPSYLSGYGGYFALVRSGMEEPSSTHSDHYISNRAYGTAAYSKGAVFLGQLSYIMGEAEFFKAFKHYFNMWKMKHPTPRDLKRVMEKASGLELDWYFEHWINTTNVIDYAVDSLENVNGMAFIHLSRKQVMPMPIDLIVTYKDGSQAFYNIPLRVMRGEKKEDFYEMEMNVLPDWPWTHPTYTSQIDGNPEDIVSIEIDPSGRMADVRKANNKWEKEE